MRLFILRVRYGNDYESEQIVLATTAEEAIEIAESECEGRWYIWREIDTTKSGLVTSY